MVATRAWEVERDAPGADGGSAQTRLKTRALGICRSSISSTLAPVAFKSTPLIHTMPISGEKGYEMWGVFVKKKVQGVDVVENGISRT